MRLKQLVDLQELLKEYEHKAAEETYMFVPIKDLSRDELMCLVSLIIEESENRHRQYLADLREVHNMYNSVEYYDDDDDDEYDDDYYYDNAWQ